MIELIEVNKELPKHIQHLYDLLKARDFNISNEKIPDFDQHVDFVKCNPYRNWYLVQDNYNIVGSAYITDDNIIGIHLSSNRCQDYIELINLMVESHQPLPPKRSSRSKYFLINANPNNENLIKALNLIKMEHIQNTYAYK